MTFTDIFLLFLVVLGSLTVIAVLIGFTLEAWDAHHYAKTHGISFWDALFRDPY